VHHLAHARGLSGYVLNSTLGVTIEIEGPEQDQQRFLEELRQRPPVLAVIDEILEETLPTVGDSGFVIRESQPAAAGLVLVPPDIATCPDCISDFRDPANRRFGYPFTNCTNCGPRYSIIQDVPYDRRFTTMAEFRMCPACEAEYHDPSDRRFHAQPNACPECGPWVELWDHERQLQKGTAAIHETQRLLAGGRILAIKGLGGFHLACDAANEDAVKLLRERKRRTDKPFALMAADIDVVEQLCEVSAADRTALTSPRRPIVLMPRRANAGVSQQLAPGIGWLGVMLPYTPLHHLLFEGGAFPALVMTSGNLSEEPIASLNEEVAPRLHPLADYVLLHNRTIHTRVDDSVVRTFKGRERTLRRSRGYAPHPIDLGFPVSEVLACGGEIKNTFCLTKQHYAIISQHIGDLENLETMQVFQDTLRHMQRFFRVSPRAVAHDLHPQYLTTRFALSLEGMRKVGVQHHHAHIASCMAENRLASKVIGVAFDGTGYGTDGKIWGGEILVCDFTGFDRAAHFRYVPLPGGDAAVRQPWRSALAYLRDAGLDPAPILKDVPPRALDVVERMLAGRLNTVDCCSCGRLFDAVAAILGIRLEANYEGQAAMELEAIAEPTDEAYPFDLDGHIIDFRETVRAMVRDANVPALASSRFHNTLAKAALETCVKLRAQERLNRVCLSGGTFQNVRLLELTIGKLRAAGFEVYIHALLPPNDGGLCLGQAVVAHHATAS
jgi:hydrogenase maturation protein HypF